ncbi:hypothetical protein [Chromohalobacter sp. 296-RDG]|uniref:hypothetical protein n=1 Tax=Chromohalobacter sp. 296-RDG TaxID=2994062 RepID=UPI0024691CA8|nr:hypothetical protein [Chromohalobacter sp. 296-RDG]
MKSSRYIVYQLLRPVSYVLIKHEDKHIYDWSIPLLLSICTIAGSSFIGAGWSFAFDMINGFSGFVQNLPGFFIAALAAIATFNRVDIDKTMDGKHPPSLDTWVGNQVVPQPLTRRRFLCLLFSYLTVESFVIAIMGVVAGSVGFVSSDGNLQANVISAWAFVIFFVFISFQLLVSTLHGMYYLAERVHY